MAERAHQLHDPAQQTTRVAQRRPALFADYLLDERVPERPRRPENLIWAARELLRLVFIASVFGAVIVALWGRG